MKIKYYLLIFTSKSPILKEFQCLLDTVGDSTTEKYGTTRWHIRMHPVQQFSQKSME